MENRLVFTDSGRYFRNYIMNFTSNLGMKTYLFK